MHQTHPAFRIVAAAIALALSGAVSAEAAKVDAERGELQIGNSAAAYSLRIAYPDGRTLEREVLAGEVLSLDPAGPGDALVDGLYTYEARPILGVAQRADDAPQRAVKQQTVPVESGTFRVLGNRIFSAVNQPEPAAGDDSDYGVRMKDQVFADDVIIQNGSLCVGFDCANGENFGFDTIRMKENNLRLHFDDTSNSGSFPSNDWTLVANDTTNGGASYFAIEDRTAGRRVVEIRAGAPANSLFIRDSGNVGLGTTVPAVPLHITDGNTPTIRLEQDGSSGFAAQTWDVAANETNFFVRDVTNGSRLPFKIRPGAPTDSLFVDPSGDVGIGGEPQNFAGFRNMTIRSGGSGSTLEHTDASGARKAFWVYNGDSNSVSFGTVAGAGPVILRPELDAGMVAIGTASPTAKLDINGDTIRLRSSRTPASASSPCNQGDFAWGADFIYVCVATNTWKRSSLSSW